MNYAQLWVCNKTRFSTCVSNPGFALISFSMWSSLEWRTLHLSDIFRISLVSARAWRSTSICYCRSCAMVLPGLPVVNGLTPSALPGVFSVPIRLFVRLVGCRSRSISTGLKKGPLPAGRSKPGKSLLSSEGSLAGVISAVCPAGSSISVSFSEPDLLEAVDWLNVHVSPCIFPPRLCRTALDVCLLFVSPSCPGGSPSSAFPFTGAPAKPFQGGP